jgi:hypothetical protein
MIAVFIESCSAEKSFAPTSTCRSHHEDRQRDRYRIMTRRPDPFKVSRSDGSSGSQLDSNMPRPTRSFRHVSMQTRIALSSALDDFRNWLRLGLPAGERA